MSQPPTLPMNYNITGELARLFKRELELCNVRQGETVVLHSDSYTYPHYPAAFMAAAIELGADVYQVVHPIGIPERNVTEVWKAADMVVDLSSYPHAYFNILADALMAGTRILRVLDREEVLKRLFPSTEVRQRAEAGAKILQAGKKMRIRSEAGTDLIVDTSGRHADALYSVSDVPGRWDIWPCGLVCTTCIEDGAEGTLVLDRGDHMKVLDLYVREPVRMQVREGRIISIDGGLEAIRLRRWFEEFEDPNTYVIAHIGWGCEKRARWNTPGQDPEVYYGNMQIAFGSNYGHFLDGRNRAKGHIDLPCLNNSVWVDDVQVLEKGKFVRDELR